MRKLLLATAIALSVFPATATAAAATPAPAWGLTSLAAPTNFKPGEAGSYYQVEATNIGAAPTDGSPVVLSDTLPAGLTVKKVELLLRIAPGKFDEFGEAPGVCAKTEAAGAVTVTCTVDESIAGTFEPARLWPSERLIMRVRVFTPGSASGALVNHATVQGGGAAAGSAESQGEACACPAPPGLSAFNSDLIGVDGAPVSQAASHPFSYTTSFSVNTELAPAQSSAPLVAAGGDVKDLEFPLPPGLLGNPTVASHCSAKDFTAQELVGFKNPERNYYVVNCPDGSAVGTVAVSQVDGIPGGDILTAIYNLVPPPGMPALFGFQVAGLPIYIETELRSGSDYGVTARVRNVSQLKRVTAATATFWGVPADPAHDPQRGFCGETGGVTGSCDAEGVQERPFFRLPTSCATQLDFGMSFATWLHPTTFFSAGVQHGPVDGCELPDFSPSIESKPSTNVADAPSGLHFNLHLPQQANEDPDGLGEADLRDAVVTLPEGFTVNPSSANGLEGCSVAQIGYLPGTSGPPEFTAAPPTCPDAAKLGKAQVHTPLLDHPLPGAVYLAKPHENPFDSLIAIYIVLDDPISGVVVKLAGEVTPDPQSGQLTTTFEDSPQTPFEDFELDFFEGARAPLRTPPTCATHTTASSLTPHTAPASGPAATPSDSFAITTAPGAGPCPATPAEQPHSPAFAAGTAAPLAGAFSPFLLSLARQDGSQELSGLDLTLPPGLTGKLAGLEACPEAALAAAQAKSGAAEQASPSCPPSSRVGSVTVAAGAGSAPFHAQGEVYLAGPYKGAPLSIAVLVPAVAGPFDLGTVVNRDALYVDPKSARIHVLADPIPTILQGVPLDVRSIDARIDRDRFTLNPTSCNEMAISGALTSSLGQSAPLTERFQVGNCAELAFKPKLSLRLIGGTKRTDHPALRAEVRMPGGGANMASVSVALPRSSFLDQGNIRTVCTRVQFAAHACPPGSIYGKAEAQTPLFDEPLRGPVYLRSSDHNLPDLVIALKGPESFPIEIEAAGRVDSVKGALRTRFEAIPDAPVSRVLLAMEGGKRKGLLVNSGDLCARAYRANGIFNAHNGKRAKLRPALSNAKCGKQGAKKRRGQGKKSGRGGNR